jgi:Tol biopolymer transport system component/DNA-binding winged helix-turn-helix (wHTH) protein
MHEPAAPALRVQFGPFELDARSGELRKGSIRLKVPSQSIEILKALLEQPGELVTREELRARLWPSDTFVDFEHGLNAAVRRLREALGDSADAPRYIETLPRRGYRFIAPLEAVPDVIVAGGTPAALPVAAAPRWRRLAFLVLLLAGLVLAAGAGIWIARDRPAAAAPDFRATRSLPVTSFSGREADPAISPDGKYVAFAWDGDNTGGNLDVYVKLIDGGEPVPLTSDRAAERAPAWSPDGRRIAFLRILDATHAEVAIVPSFGGAETRLESTVATGDFWPTQAISWAPDGRSILFAARPDSGSTAAIFAAFVETDTRRQLTTPGSGFYDAAPRVSPDGRQLGFIRRVSGAWVGYPFVQPMAGLQPAGAARRVTDDQQASTFDWFPDGRSIVYDRERETLWRVSADGGAPEPLLGAAPRAMRPCVAPDGTRILYQRQTFDMNIWRLSARPGQGADGSQAAAVPLITSTGQDTEPQYSPDGQRISFSSSRSGEEDIWVSASDGTHPRQITTGFRGGSARWSPDGRSLAFDSMRSGTWNIYAVSSAQGGTPRAVTAEQSSNVRPSWSRDGRWIYFGSDRSGRWEIWKIPSSGGQPVQLTTRGGFEAFESPDGAALYFANRDAPGLWRVSVTGGEAVPVVDHGVQSHFAVADRGLFLVNVTAQPVPTVEVLDFSSGRVETIGSLPPATNLNLGGPGFHVSRDGKFVLYTNRGVIASDITMLVGINRTAR